MQISIVLNLTVTDEDGNPIDADEAAAVADDAEQAIRNRLMGEGFLPDHLLVETYNIQSGFEQ